MSQDESHGVVGATVRWTWSKGPVSGVTHEHEFRRDGTVAWRVVDGPGEGHSAVEEEYAALRVAGNVQVISYRAANGYTLTVALNLQSGEMVGFASGEGEWHPLEGRFEVTSA